jgi:putative transposase
VALAELDDRQRQQAMRRWQLLRAHVDEGLPLARAAAAAGVPYRTAQRWLASYRAGGLAALAPAGRSDRGTRRFPRELVCLIEALAVTLPAPTAAFIHRRVVQIAKLKGWPVPSYRTVVSVVGALDRGLVTLAHEGPVAYRDRYELVLRRDAQAPNELWQADHTLLDVLVLDHLARPARPWLAAILDDHSRAIAGYTVSLSAPAAMHTALALRQAICRKTDPAWSVYGLPDILYTDHGSDFISEHIEQVCVDLHVQLVHSTGGRPQGRGKIERFFGSLTTELLPDLPGHLVAGRQATPPALTLHQLDDAIGRWIVHTYHRREHSETGIAPAQAWLGAGWLPRTIESLEQLDLLLVMVAKRRIVHRDGIRFEGNRYLDPTLAAYVGEPVTIRYDPRDLAEIRVFHHNRFLCRAISPEHADETISLKDIQAARNARRRALRNRLNDLSRTVGQYLPAPQLHPVEEPVAEPAPPRTHHRPRLRVYREDKA